jgi:hypothetical protein
MEYPLILLFPFGAALTASLAVVHLLNRRPWWAAAAVTGGSLLIYVSGAEVANANCTSTAGEYCGLVVFVLAIAALAGWLFGAVLAAAAHLLARGLRRGKTAQADRAIRP